MPHSRILIYVPDLISARFPGDKGRPRLLEKFLSRARAVPVKREFDVLEECFQLPPEEFPVAALERLGETDTRDQACWWRADPVHLMADRDQLVMLPQAMLAATFEEMRQIAETFNKDYAAEGCKLEFPEPERGYLQVPADWRCHGCNPASVAGKAVTEFMPSGTDADRVRKLMTEIQMLLHTHPVNQAREAAGQPTINSVWLWGGGPLPDRAARAPARIVSSLPLVRGLAKLAGQACEAWSAEPGAQTVKGEWLVALSVNDFGADLLRLDQELMAPMWRALLRGRVREIRFYPGGNSVYELTPLPARHFWRRARPLVEQLRGPDDLPAH